MGDSSEDAVIYRARLHRLVFLRPFLWILLGTAILLGVLVGPMLVPADQSGPIAPPWFWAIVAFGGLIAVWGLFRLVARIACVGTTELIVTPRKVIFRSGFFGRQTVEMVNSKIETVQVDQSFLGRIFDYGTIVITGTGGSLEPVAMIAHPRRLQQAIRAA